MIKIDKSLFSAEELAQYEALIAKGSVEVEDEVPPAVEPEKEPEKEVKDEMVETAKSAVSPEMTAALERMETLAKSIEMKEYAEIAKKYAPLGENEEELAKSLYEMKKSNEDNYNAYINILDKSLALVEKSGVFTEIGKSTSGTAGSTVDKIEAAADEIQKSDATISRAEAVAKAWENNPELIAEYDKEYKA